MIEIADVLDGVIDDNSSLDGNLNNAIEYVVPMAQNKEVIATTEDQIITPDDGYNTLESVVIKRVTNDIDSSITPTNIRRGVDILGVKGEVLAIDDLKLQDKTINPVEDGTSVTYDKEYDGLGVVNVTPIKSNMIKKLTANNIKRGVEILDIVGTYGATSQIKYVTPSQEEQIIKPDSGIEFLSQVTIQPVTSGIDDDIISTNIRRGVNILGVEGEFDGDMSFQSKTVSASANDVVEVTPDTGYDALDKVTVKRVTSNIDSNIQADNIKRGINILGIEGTYAPDPSMEDKYITPKTYIQNVTPDEGYSYFDKVTVGAVTSSIDSNIKSSNIRENVSVLGVVVTLEPVKGESIIIQPSVETQIIQPSDGKNSITSITVNRVTSAIDGDIISSNIKKGISILGVDGDYEGATVLQTKTVTPTDGEQIITADEGYDALTSVVVQGTPVEDIVVDPDMSTKTYTRSDGKFINSVTVNQVTSDVDANIQPENIKQNMSILGVVGTFTGEQQNYFGALNVNGKEAQPGILNAILAVPDDLVITYAMYMFHNCQKLKKAPKLDYSNVTDCTSMFAYTYAMTDGSGLVNFKKITNAYRMFYHSGITSIDFSSWDFTNLTTVSGMFNSASKLKTLILDSKSSTKLTNMSSFCSYTKMTNVSITNCNFPNVTTVSGIFSNASSLSSVDFSGSNFTKVKTYSSMFYYAGPITTIDISAFHYTGSITTDKMFYGCDVLQHIDMRNLDISKSTSYSNMFYNVPTDCEIIVMNDACKTWMATKFATMTNVKTVAEYEAEQSA